MAFPRKYDYRCSSGHIFERTVDTDTPPQLCECGLPAEVIWIRFPGTTSAMQAKRFDPVTVFRKPDGTYCFPGRSNDPTPEGMQRVELTSSTAIRKFEREENLRVKQKHEQRLEREDKGFTPIKRAKRDMLWDQMAGRAPIVTKDGQKENRPFSAPGRKFAEVAMAKSDERQSLSRQAQRFEPNFHIEAFSLDSSNRLPHNDVDTGLKDRK